MISPPIWLLLVLAVGLPHTLGSESTEDVPSDQAEGESAPNEQDKSFPDAGPLFLTPYIENCSYYEARQLSKIPLFQMMANVTAYSGYITVNKTAQSNLFFLLTEVEGNSSDAPLLLWTQGGPGLSALFGLFLENGPLALDMYSNYSPKVYPRINTLQKNMSVLYVDVPVGAGFSYTKDSENGYPRRLEDIVAHIEEFLQQFLLVFSEYQGRKLYLGGESYGARYSVAVANHFLTNSTNLTLSYEGVISGSGFLGPVLDLADSSNFLYQLSMVNERGREAFKAQFEKMRVLASNVSTMPVALFLLFSTIFTNTETPTLYQNLTQYNDHASPLFTERPPIMYVCVGFLNSSVFKAQIHVGNVSFQYNNPILLKTFAFDWLTDISPMVEHVLNKSRMLSYIGQMDTLFPAVNQQAYTASLNWTFASQYRETTRTLWSKPNSYGAQGYIKKVNGFTEAVVLGMSHYSSAEKSDEVYYLITTFVAESSNIKENEHAREEAQA